MMQKITTGLLFIIFLGISSGYAQNTGNDNAFQPSTNALPAELSPAHKIWEIRLGTHQYSIPTIDRGKIFIGTNDLGLDHPVLKRTGGGIVTCLDAATGSIFWQLPIPRFPKERHPPHYFNHWRCGVCSSPIVQDDRIYIVGNRGDILCLDRNGQADGNQGPFKDESTYMGYPADTNHQPTATEGDIIWRYDMLKDLSVYPHDVCGSTVLLQGDYLYACTSNGVDRTHDHVTNKSAPSLIVLDKNTGRLLAQDNERIGERVFHGQWSSPISGTVNGRTIIYYGGGDGILYAFEPPQAKTNDNGVKYLQKLWARDANPPDYRFKDEKPIRYSGWRNKSPQGPSDIISTPVFHDNKVYVAIGQSPIHGPGRGMLSCLDALTGKPIWSSKLVDRTLSTPAIDDGQLYISDFTGQLHCFDARTGQRYWVHNLQAGVWCASPLVAQGKVYICTERNVFWVLKASQQKKVLSRFRLNSTAITLVADDGTLYLPTQKRLAAYRF